MREDSNKKILVVDDEKAVTNALSEILMEHGYTCKKTTDPSAALDMIKAEPYVLVLSDIRMPELSGIELMKKAKEINPEIDFILITAVDHVDTALEAVKMGACDYITKPFNMEEIIASVDNAIRNREGKETEYKIQTIANTENAAIRGEMRITQTIHEFAQHFQIVAELFGTDGEVYSKMVMEHSERVEFLAINVAKRIGLPPGLRRSIATAAILHDIGKIGMVSPTSTPDNCLGSQDKQICKMHPVRGEVLVHPISFLRTASLLIRHHHEKYGGGGYPDGLKGEKIPLGSRIIAVADAYDRYKDLLQQTKGALLAEEEAKSYIKKGSGELFDPKVVKPFLAYLDEHEQDEEFLKKMGRRIG